MDVVPFHFDLAMKQYIITNMSNQIIALQPISNKGHMLMALRDLQGWPKKWGQFVLRFWFISFELVIILLHHFGIIVKSKVFAVLLSMGKINKGDQAPTTVIVIR